MKKTVLLIMGFVLSLQAEFITKEQELRKACSIENKEIRAVFQLEQKEHEVLSLSPTEYLKGYCTIVIKNGFNLQVSYINPDTKMIVDSSMGLFTYKMEDNQTEVISLSGQEFKKFEHVLKSELQDKALKYLNKSIEKNTYLNKILSLDTNSTSNYKIFTYSSNVCGNCTAFKDVMSDKEITYLYLPISQSDYEANNGDMLIEDNIKFVSDFAKSIGNNIGTPTTIIYSKKENKFVYFGVGLHESIISQIEKYLAKG